MYKRSELYWVKTASGSFAALKPFYEYYKKIGIVTDAVKLEYGRDYKWFPCKIHNNEGYLYLAYSQSFAEWAKINKGSHKPDVF
jgi:hypothetical protein